jgi:hypothetical protein
MKNLKLIFVLSTVFVLAAISCKKGDAGPAGPPGPAGPDSVIYSPWITLNLAQTVNSGGDTSYDQTLTAASITQAVIDKGFIMSYLDLSSGSGQIFPTASVGFAVTEIFSVGSIFLSIPFPLAADAKYRYVIILGTIQGNRFVSGPAAGLTTSEVQNMSYKDVLKLSGQSGSISPN